MTPTEYYDQLEKLVEQRRKLAAQTDQLYMMTQEYLIDRETPLTITIETKNAIFKGRHNAIIRGVLRHLYEEYTIRLQKKEAQIQEHSKQLNEKTI